MVIITSTNGKVLYKGDWEVGLFNRCHEYMQRVDVDLEVTHQNGTPLFNMNRKDEERFERKNLSHNMSS